jgi:plastocyanin
VVLIVWVGQSSFEFSFENESVATITHGGGEDITPSEIEVRVGDEVMYEDGSAISDANLSNSGWDGESISSGQSLRLKNTSADYSGETVRIVWNDPSGGSSNNLADQEWAN